MSPAVGARRLLVGVGQADVVNQPRRSLIDALRVLGELDVAVQVAMFADGPVRAELEPLADVRVFTPLERRSVSGRVEALARRLGEERADAVFDRRTAADRAWIDEPDAIHLHGVLAGSLLRYVRDPAVPVTAFIHPWDFRPTGISPAEQRRLVDRVDRFLVPGEHTREHWAPVDAGPARDDLIAIGVDTERIVAAPDPVERPSAVMDQVERRRIRRRLGVDEHQIVVAVLPVEDWVDCPDLTLGVAWELERLGGDGVPTLLWVGMPYDDHRRWPVEFDIDRMGLSSVLLTTADAAWSDLVGAADVIHLPLRTSAELPVDPAGIAEAAELAARRGRPVACWEGHPFAEALLDWRGTVVPRGDVEGMAAALWSMTSDPAALAEARLAGWSLGTADLETLFMLGIPAP